MLASASGLSLTIVPSTPGDYDIVVRSDVSEAQCTLTVLRSGEATFGECRVRRGYVYQEHGWPAGNGGATLTMNGENGADVPRSVDVQVFDANANEIDRRTLQPDYLESYPNGRECDATPFLHASERIELPEVLPAPPSGDAGAAEPRDAGIRTDAGTDADAAVEADGGPAID